MKKLPLILFCIILNVISLFSCFILEGYSNDFDKEISLSPSSEKKFLFLIREIFSNYVSTIESRVAHFSGGQTDEDLFTDSLIVSLIHEAKDKINKECLFLEKEELLNLNIKEDAYIKEKLNKVFLALEKDVIFILNNKLNFLLKNKKTNLYSFEKIDDLLPCEKKKIREDLRLFYRNRFLRDAIWSIPIEKEISYRVGEFHYFSKSRMKCLNSGISAIIERKRSFADAELINFHSTEHYFLDSEGKEKRVFSATRGGVISEYAWVNDHCSQADKERKRSNLQIARELLKCKTEEHLEKYHITKKEASENYSENNPLIVNVQIISMLNPPVFQEIFMNSFLVKDSIPPEKNEKLHLEDEIQALSFFNEAFQKSNIFSISGYDIHIQFKIRFWNFGMSDKPFALSNYFFSKPLMNFQDKYNDLAQIDLENRVRGFLKKLEKEKIDLEENVAKHSSVLKSLLEELKLESYKKRILREEIYSKKEKKYQRKKYLSFFPFISSLINRGYFSCNDETFQNLLKRWQESADREVLLFSMIRQYSEVGEDYVQIAEKERDIIDLFIDEQELYKFKNYYDERENLGNRYALVTILNILSHEMGETLHYHCKSGKDRTGFADIETRVCYELKRVKGRFLSYQEKGSELEKNIRKPIVLQSGNIDEIPLRNTGFPGLKNKQCPAPRVSKDVDVVAKGLAYCFLFPSD